MLEHIHEENFHKLELWVRYTAGSSVKVRHDNRKLPTALLVSLQQTQRHQSEYPVRPISEFKIIRSQFSIDITIRCLHMVCIIHGLRHDHIAAWMVLHKFDRVDTFKTTTLLYLLYKKKLSGLAVVLQRSGGQSGFNSVTEIRIHSSQVICSNM